MASAMASAAAHNIPPPYAIPVGPRVRPPRLLRGTKAANTDPKPDTPPLEKNEVWVQGKWRKIGSNAVKDQEEVRSTQVEKALRHATHGTNIYAYSHMRTNQVVYSLSRVMQNNKILPQLMFHGKKTVPSALRRDLWRPYFSIHFSPTPAGALAGLQAYRRLRELATWRQLRPPPELLIATEADVQKSRDRFAPFSIEKRLKDHKTKNFPIKNQLLPKKLRAKKLMDQKASSVADVAHVLSLMDKEMSPVERLEYVERMNALQLKDMSSRATRRLKKIRQAEAVKQGQLEARQKSIQIGEGDLGLSRHAVSRIALEHDGVLGRHNMLADLKAIRTIGKDPTKNTKSPKNGEDLLSGVRKSAEFDEEEFRTQFIETWKAQNNKYEDPTPDTIEAAIKEERETIESQPAQYDQEHTGLQQPIAQTTQAQIQDTRQVYIYWADLRDGVYAEQWSQNVQHEELEPRAVVKRTRSVIREEASIDEDGLKTSEQRQRVLVQESSTPHVFGRGSDSSWYENPEKLTERLREGRETQLEAWQRTKFERSKKIFDQFIAMERRIEENKNAKKAIENAVRQHEKQATEQSGELIIKTPSKETVRRPQTEEERNQQAMLFNVDQELAANRKKLVQLRDDYPNIHEHVKGIAEWRTQRDSLAAIISAQEDLRQMDALYDPSDRKARARLQRIDRELASYEGDYPELLGFGSSETDLRKRTSAHEEVITELRQKISALKAGPVSEETETAIKEINDNISNRNLLVRSDRQELWERRQNFVDRIYEGWTTYHAEAADFLRQRIHAKKSGDKEQIKSIDAELQEQLQSEIQRRLGSATVASKSETRLSELDSEMREKGIEMPPPRPEAKSLWAKFKSTFGQ